MEATAKYNRGNPAVKRILQEVKEMQSNPSPDFMAMPLEVPDPNPASCIYIPARSGLGCVRIER
jgi:hypothetical protein